MSTFFPKKINQTVKKWFIIDASNTPIGRLSTVAANILSGKNKPIWTPFLDMGDNVIIINTAKAILTGKKSLNKIYRRTTTRPGSMVETKANIMQQTFPNKIIEHAIKGMLPKGSLGQSMYRKLRVYQDDKHQHISQKPEPVIIQNHFSLR